MLLTLIDGEETDEVRDPNRNKVSCCAMHNILNKYLSCSYEIFYSVPDLVKNANIQNFMY